jgi:hypothetical protein
MQSLHSLDRYWCPIVAAGSLTFIASIIAAPLWR